MNKIIILSLLMVILTFPVRGEVCKWDYKKLVDIVKSSNFIITSTNSGRHNVGSSHYENRAIDVRTRGKTNEEIELLIGVINDIGLIVKDERTKPKDQRIWSGPHLHLQVPDCKPIIKVYEESIFVDDFLNMCGVSPLN